MEFEIEANDDSWSVALETKYEADTSGVCYREYLSEPGVLHVFLDGAQTTLRRPAYDAADIENGAATGAIRAPINGRVSKVFVSVGATVAKGDKIAVVEAMKMEHVIAAAIDGTIDKIAVTEGAQITQGTLIAHIAG